VRVGLFGGSFDPIHRGHVAAARAALGALDLEKVLFLPTARPPHKAGRAFAPALRRYAMAELALLDEPALEVSDAELDATREIYTIATLARFRAEAPALEPVLLVGADSLAAFATWRRWEEILATTELGVLPRPGWERERIEPELPRALARALTAARVRWVPLAPDPVSASEIRRRLAAGEPLPEGWLDPRVLTFVAKYALYR
jgi:nicotinate-nucleotide adenylyltransferase